MNIIFLDVDGVLNNHKTTDHVNGYRGIDSDRVKLLKELCDKTDSKIVLCSTWRLHRNPPDAFWKRLNEKFKEAGLEVYDCTPDFYWNKRAYEISEWMRNKELDHIVILDDEDFYWDSKLEKYWVDTGAFGGVLKKPFDGLTEDHINYILKNYDEFKLGEENDAENK